MVEPFPLGSANLSASAKHEPLATMAVARSARTSRSVLTIYTTATN